MPAYLGVDLAASAQRRSGWAILDGTARLLGIGLAATDADILALAHRWQPRLIAVDAPLSLPLGLHCLDETCPCRPTAADGRKAAERELLRRGIPLYLTTKRSIIKAMIVRAMALTAALERDAFTVLEVYPYACKVVLFGRPIPRKTTAHGRDWLRDRLSDLIPGLGGHPGRLNHDQLDALAAAYTACLADGGLAEALGDPQEGLIYLPLPRRRAVPAC